MERKAWKCSSGKFTGREVNRSRQELKEMQGCTQILMLLLTEDKPQLGKFILETNVTEGKQGIHTGSSQWKNRVQYKQKI